MRLALVFAVAQVEKRVFRFWKMFWQKNGDVWREKSQFSRFFAVSVAFCARPFRKRIFAFSAFSTLSALNENRYKGGCLEGAK